MAKKKVTRGHRSLDWKFWVLVTIILAGSVLLAYQFGAFKKNCKDEACFKQALDDCDYAKYLGTRNYNYYLYTIQGTKDGNCRVDIQLKKMAIGTEPEKIKQFEGKRMKCHLPKTEIAKMGDLNFEGMLNYCTGPLKEAMYELIIEKLYTIIIKNMGSIVGAVEDTIRGEI